MEAIKDQTRIKTEQFGEKAKTVKSIFSLDSSLMYGMAMETMVTGAERWRESKNHFRPVYADPKYWDQKNAERILQFYRWQKKLTNFQTKRRGGEMALLWGEKRYQVDGRGLLPDGRELIIEIYGDRAHCCNVHRKQPYEIHPTRKTGDGAFMTYSDIEKADETRLREIQKAWPDAEIMVVQMCQFNLDYTNETGVHHSEYKQFLSLYPEYKVDRDRKTEREVLADIQTEKIHGFILADFNTSEGLRKKTEDFPLFFKKVPVGRDDVGALMKDYLEKEGKLKSPQTELISSHFAKNHLIATNLCKFYLDMGVEVTSVQLIIEYDLTTKLKDLVKHACDLRFNAAEKKNQDEMTLGNLAKQLIVSSYGRMLLNPGHFVQVKYVDENGLLKASYKGDFSLVDYVGEIHGQRYYEIKGKKKTTNFAYPYHCGNWILNSSKLHMLKLVYHVIQPCMDPRSYSYFVTQTDSLSIICSEDDCDAWFRNCILDEAKEQFEKLRGQYFVLPGGSVEARRSKYTAGIFKVEWKADMVVGVSSKVYAAFTDKNKPVKLSCRSVPANIAKKLKFEDFQVVVKEQKPIEVKIEGFNFVNGAMYRETMMKSAIAAMYIKRKVQSDGTTATLDL